MLIEHNGHRPHVPKSAFVEASAQIVGDVVLDTHASVWFNAVVRSDGTPIRIGRNSNIQDNCVLHADGRSPLTVGDNVTIGHGAIVHGCTIGSNCLIGMGAIILDHVIIEDWSIIGAGSLVASGTKIPHGTVAIGVPAKAIRSIHAGDRLLIKGHCANYLLYKKAYLAERARCTR